MNEMKALGNQKCRNKILYNKRNIKHLNNRHDKIRLLGLDKEMCFEKGFEGVQGRSITIH